VKNANIIEVNWIRVLFPQVLTVLLLVLCAAQLVAWLPSYLTWPWWVDHDVFATLALSWSVGELPYKDLLCNNFPGEIYLFWICGQLFGWGVRYGFNFLDVLILLALIVSVLIWSRIRLGCWLPGAISSATLLTYYLTQDYSSVAQRDWHAPALGAMSLMSAEACPRPVGRILSSLCFALGFCIRPQVICFLPAIFWALAHADWKDENPWKSCIIPWIQWSFAVCGFTILTFAPLIYAGIWGDFLHNLEVHRPGGAYNHVTLITIGARLLSMFLRFKFWSIVCILLLIYADSRLLVRHSMIAWILVMIGSFVYAAIAPKNFAYHSHPFYIVWSISLSVLVEAVQEDVQWNSRARLAFVLLVIGLNVQLRPSFCQLSDSRASIASLRAGIDPRRMPASYRNPYAETKAPWADYYEVQDYLRKRLGPRTRLANALEGVALNGPLGRLSAFPAESVTWLWVNPEDEARFVQALRSTPDSVVVWAPSSTFLYKIDRFPRLVAAIHEYYEHEATIGVIEVWRRKPA
jgi:hypothetical protein